MASKERNSSVELLRILLMLSIVAVHIRPGNKLISFFVATAFAWQVDSFMAISGWYGIKLTWKKFFTLWSQIAFYSILSFSVGRLLFPGEFPISGFRITGAWFGECYLALMLVAPLLNAGIDALCAQGRRIAIAAWGGAALMMTLTWAPVNLMTGVNALGFDNNLSFGIIAFVYVSARFMRQLDIKPVSTKWLVLAIVGYALTILAIGSVKSFADLCRHHNVTMANWSWLTQYHAPHVWVMALAVFLLFKDHVKIPEWLNKPVLFLSPSMFAVYLIHAATPLGNCLRALVVSKIESAVESDVLAFLLSVVIVFCASLSIDLLRRGCVCLVCANQNPKI